MNPCLQNHQYTIRLGTPPANLVEKILNPILKEPIAPTPEGCKLWRCPPVSDNNSVLFPLDAFSTIEGAAETLIAKRPTAFRDHYTCCIVFLNQLGNDTISEAHCGEARMEALRRFIKGIESRSDDCECVVLGRAREDKQYE